jgi:hypothetical protein
MEYFAGLDVAMEETAICVIDQEGKVVLEIKVTTDPDAIFRALKPYAAKLRRVAVSNRSKAAPPFRMPARRATPWPPSSRACRSLR